MSNLNYVDDQTVELENKDLRFRNGGRLIMRAPQIFDHFAYGAGAFNSHVPQNWVTTETGAATPFAPGATGISVATCVTGGTTNNAEELAGKLVGWTPSTMATKNKLIFEARLKFVGATTATDGDAYFGLANAVTYASSLPFVVSAASAFTTSAPTEFCGFGYSSIPTSGTMYSASGNLISIVTEKSSVAAVQATNTAVVKDSNYHTYRIEMDSSANAQFFIDDVYQGSVAAATTASTALTPYFNAVAKNSHTHTMTIDYIGIYCDIV